MFILIVVASFTLAADVDAVKVVKDQTGYRLQVNGEDFFIKGMNWDFMPIGTTYTYSLWSQPDEIIMAALDQEMPLLKAMGVNAIRQYVGVPPKWVQYIYEKYGIYTVINHAFGRYGVDVDGAYIPNTDYSDKEIREALLKQVREMVEEFKDTPGILIWMLGNENNYGLFWDGAETEALPGQPTKQEKRARQWRFAVP
jgi:beta-galactosidase/beta-glucuronidase